MGERPQSTINPQAFALQAGLNSVPKKKAPVVVSSQAPMQSSLQPQPMQSQAPTVATPKPVVTPKIGGITPTFGATNINAQPTLGGATPQELGKQQQIINSQPNLPQELPETGVDKTVPQKVDYIQSIKDLKETLNTSDSLDDIRSVFPEFSKLDDGALADLIATTRDNEDLDDILGVFPELNKSVGEGNILTDNFITDLGSGIGQSVSNYGKLGKKLGIKAGNALRPVFGKEKYSKDELASMYDNSDTAADQITNRQTPEQKKTTAGAIGETVGTVGQALVMPTGVSSLEKIPAIAKVAQKAPVISSMIKGALQGGIGQEQYNLVTEGRASTKGELALSAGLGAAMPLLGGILKATKPFLKDKTKALANRLQLSGIINGGKFTQIKENLIAEGVDGIEKATVDDAAEFLTERGVKGTPEQQAAILEDVATKSRQAKQEVLNLSTTLHNPTSAKTLAETLVEELGTAKSQATKATAAKAQNLLDKIDNGGLSLNEMDELRAMGWKELNTRTSAGNVKVSQSDVDNLIGEVRKFIEDTAQAEGLPQLVGYEGGENLIKMLNNQTSTAKAFAEGILKKDSASATQQILNFVSARGAGTILGGYAGSQVGIFPEDTTAGKIGNIIVGAIAGGIIDNPSIKSNLAARLNKLSGAQQSNIRKRMETGGKQVLSRENKDVVNGLKDIIMGNTKKLPDSLPYKKNVNSNRSVHNLIPISNNGNTAGAVVAPGGVVKPKATPKSKQTTREIGVIGKPYPNSTVPVKASEEVLVKPKTKVPVKEANGKTKVKPKAK